MSQADGTSGRNLDLHLQKAARPAVRREGDLSMQQYGPNQAAVESFMARAAALTHAEGLSLFEARVAWFELRADASVEPAALQSALRVASRSGRLTAYQQARTHAAAAFRGARRGDVGPWLSVAHAVSNAAGALVVADLLSQRDFQLLYGPWEQAVGHRRLIAVGPGDALGARRHRIGIAAS
jgi:hypothetical protein